MWQKSSKFILTLLPPTALHSCARLIKKCLLTAVECFNDGLASCVAGVWQTHVHSRRRRASGANNAVIFHLPRSAVGRRSPSTKLLETLVVLFAFLWLKVARRTDSADGSFKRRAGRRARSHSELACPLQRSVHQLFALQASTANATHPRNYKRPWIF